MAGKIEKGTVLGGRFRLEEMIGGGGMGSVWAAFDADQGHRVAVKLLSARLADATEFRERFLDESEHAARIPHPHILTIYEHGDDDGRHWIAMRLVGDDLAGLLARDGKLAVRRALNLADQVAWALDVANGQGLVHRDVKPGNVLLDPRRSDDEPDHAYLTDFGIAKLVDADRALTRTGAFVGTVSYASPEQAAGTALDGRSDQYALACLLFEMVTGSPPFRAETSEQVLRLHREAPRAAVVTDLPEPLRPVLERGLAIDREERFATCRELVATARTAMRSAEPQAGPEPPPTVVPGQATQVHRTAPTEAAPPPPPPPSPPSGRPRRRVPLSLVAGFVALGVGLTLLLAGGGDDEDPGPAGTTSNARTVQSTGDGTETIAPGPPQDREEAEQQVRETIDAYAGAEGEQQLCALKVAEDRETCLRNENLATPTAYEVKRLALADDEAEAQVVQDPTGDSMRFELRREAGEWRVADVQGFDWKDAEEAAVAETVMGWGSATSAGSACKLLAAAQQFRCGRIRPREPVVYDLVNVSASPTSGRGSVLARVDADTSVSFSLVQEGGDWRISEIS